MSIGLVFRPAVQVGSSRDDLLANDTIADAAMHCDMQNQQMPNKAAPTHLENRLEIAGNATPSPAPIIPLEIIKGISMKPRSAAVGVKTVNKDHNTTPPPSTTLEEYFVAI